MKPIVRIGYLIGEHEDWHRKQKGIPKDEPSISFKNCPGCLVCDEIDKLSVENGLKSSTNKKAKKSGGDRGKLTLEYTEYKSLIKQGLTKKDIAEKYKVSPSTITKQVQRWEREEKRKPVEKQYSKEENEYLDTILNGDANERINKLIQENADLVAENEKYKSEYLKKEEELLFELEKWKKQAFTYQTECGRLTKNLAEERKEAEKYKGEKLALRIALKAVL